MHFVQAACAQMIEALVANTKKKKPQIRAELETKSPNAVAVHYFNWLMRLVPPQPRKVHIASGLRDDPMLVGLKPQFELLISRLRSGHDVNEYLPLGAHTQAYSIGSNSSSYDKDGLLNFWGIHHFHFHKLSDKQGRRSERGRLLFTAIKRDDAYAIAVGPHEFANTRLLGIMRKEWPNSGLAAPLKGVLGTQRGGYTPDEIVQLRNAGIFTLHELDGDVFYVGAGTSAGTGDEVGWRASRFLETIVLAEEWSKTHKHAVRTAITQAGKIVPAKLELTVVLHWDNVILMEKNSRVGIPFL
jgi:hypothetical protein